MNLVELHTPIDEAAIRSLRVGDQVRLTGTVVTARDAAHKYMKDTFFQASDVAESEQSVLEVLKRLWRGGVMYHCGPVVAHDPGDGWRFVSAGPTTSIREEPYEAEVIRYFGLRAVVGKGGMGPKTLAACQEYGAAYLHAVGGAATLIATCVKKVLGVYKMEELGVPDAFWVVSVEGFPAVVTMDTHGVSLHEKLFEESGAKLQALL